MVSPFTHSPLTQSYLHQNPVLSIGHFCTDSVFALRLSKKPMQVHLMGP